MSNVIEIGRRTLACQKRKLAVLFYLFYFIYVFIAFLFVNCHACSDNAAHHQTVYILFVLPTEFMLLYIFILYL